MSQELPDDIRVHLHSLQADMRWLFGRVAQEPDAAGILTDSVLERLSKIEASVKKMKEALEPFASFSVNVDDEGWTSNIHRESISTWFGPSDFRRVRSALEGEAI